MPKGKPNKGYTEEFKKRVVETMRTEKLGYRETAQRFGIKSDRSVRNWEGVYLTWGPEGFTRWNGVVVEGKADPGNCPKREKKICRPGCSDCVQRRNT